MFLKTALALGLLPYTCTLPYPSLILRGWRIPVQGQNEMGKVVYLPYLLALQNSLEQKGTPLGGSECPVPGGIQAEVD